MIKTKICGIGSVGRFNYITVEKNKNFFWWLRVFLEEGFNYSGMVGVDDVETKKGWIIVNKKIKDYTDTHEIYTVKNTRIDVFYGKEKIFITINTPVSNRQKFMKVLRKISIWKK